MFIDEMTLAAVAARFYGGRLTDSCREFTMLCVNAGLDPTGGIVQPVRFEDGAGLRVTRGVASVPVLVSLARGSYAVEGIESPQWCDSTGAWRDVWAATEAPVAARARLRLKGLEEGVSTTAHFAEVGGSGDEWRRFPSRSLYNCALAAALRLLAPEKLAGFCIPEEVESIGKRLPLLPNSKVRVGAVGKVESAGDRAERREPVAGPRVALDISSPVDDYSFPDPDELELSLDEAWESGVAINGVFWIGQTLGTLPESRLNWLIRDYNPPAGEWTDDLTRTVAAIRTVRAVLKETGILAASDLRDRTFKPQPPPADDAPSSGVEPDEEDFEAGERA